MSESDEAGVLFERYSRYVVGDLSAFAAIEKGKRKGTRGGRWRRGKGIDPLEESPSHGEASQAFFLHARMKLNHRSGVRSRTSSDYGTKMIDD